MQLLLRRSQRDDGWFDSAITFVLDIRLELDAEEQALFEHYKLGSFVVYESSDLIAHRDAAIENFDRAAQTPVLEATALTIATALWDITAGATRSIMTTLSLSIDFDGLLAGQHIESDDLDSLLGAELAIVSSCEALADHLQLAMTYDGSEELLELSIWQDRKSHAA